MEHGAEQLTDMAISETSRIANKTAKEIENNETTTNKIEEETVNEMEHLTKQAIKVAEVAAISAAKKVDHIVERNTSWDIEF